MSVLWTVYIAFQRVLFVLGSFCPRKVYCSHVLDGIFNITILAAINYAYNAFNSILDSIRTIASSSVLLYTFGYKGVDH